MIRAQVFWSRFSAVCETSSTSTGLLVISKRWLLLAIFRSTPTTCGRRQTWRLALSGRSNWRIRRPRPRRQWPRCRAERLWCGHDGAPRHRDPGCRWRCDRPNFGAYFTEVDYAQIPRWDFPTVSPNYVGDDSWGRAANPRHNNCCERPSPDDI